MSAEDQRYLVSNNVAKLVDEIVGDLIECKPEGTKEDLTRHIVQSMVFRNVNSEESRLDIAAGFAPEGSPTFRPGGATKKSFANRTAGFSHVDGGGGTSSLVPTQAGSGGRHAMSSAYSRIAHNMSIDVLHGRKKGGAEDDADKEADDNGDVLKLRGSIAGYNVRAALFEKPFWSHSTKICATIGPASYRVDTLVEMMNNGMHVARLNFSHGDRKFHRQAVQNLRKAMEQTQMPVAISADLRGPEIRMGDVPCNPNAMVNPGSPTGTAGSSGNSIFIRKGDTIIISGDSKFATEPTLEQQANGSQIIKIYSNYEKMCSVVSADSRVLLSEGNLETSVFDVNEELKEVSCQVLTHHFNLQGFKSVNLPGVNIDLPFLSEVDKEDIDFAIKECEIRVILASFVQNIEDVRQLRAYLGSEFRHTVKIIAEIENQEGIANFDEILVEADGIMVGRGDLGAELPLKKLFLAQKMMVSKCNAAGKPVIVAAQLLESMTVNPHPTRAEVNDIANAVLDGTDSLQLSAETAAGEFPVEAVKAANEVASEAQAHLHAASFFQSMISIQKKPMPINESIASSAVSSAYELNAKAIIAVTTSGDTARFVSKYFPACPVIAVCKNKDVMQYMGLVRHVVPFHYEGMAEDDRVTRVEKTIDKMKEIGMVHVGDMVIAVHADSYGNEIGFANLTRAMVVP